MKQAQFFETVTVLALFAVGCEATHVAAEDEPRRDAGAVYDAVDTGDVHDEVPSCAPSTLDGVAAFTQGAWDPLGYPPYAIDGCTLVYVAALDGGLGELRKRDLATGREDLLAPAADSPNRP